MENKRGYLGGIQKYSQVGTGSFSNVYMADYNGQVCAYKEFWDFKYITDIKDRIIKLFEYYGDLRYAFPYLAIYKHPKDEYFKAYIMDLFSFYESLNDIDSMSLEKKKQILLQGRELVEELHKNYKILHCDITPWNIWYNKTLDKVVLGDFDGYIDLKDKKDGENPNLHSPMLLEYFKNNGIDKDADIFLFNICCYAFLNDCHFYGVLKKINDGIYGNIESSKAKEIFDSYKKFDTPKSIKKEYVIDYL